MAQLRVLVVSPSKLHAYWELSNLARSSSPDAAQPVAQGELLLRCSDLSGQPTGRSLDGKGWRLVPLAGGARSVFLSDLPSGHLLWLELGEITADGFRPLLAAPPVEMPWTGPVALPKAAVQTVSRS